MAQHDYTIANQTFPATRTDLNNVFAAIVSQNSGATAPSTTYAYMLWYDTTTDILKMRNANDDAWVDLFTIDQVGDTATPSTGGAGTAQGSNLIINGAKVIDQRNAGASVSGDGQFPVDRWKASKVGAGAFSMQQSSTAPSGFNHSVVCTVTTADTSIAASDEYSYRHFVEAFNFSHANWGTSSAYSVTLSFWVRSSVTGTYAVGFRNNAGNRTNPSTYTISSANTWEYKTITVAGDTTGTWEGASNSIGVGVIFSLGAGSNFQGTANTWNASNTWSTASATQWISNSGSTFYITGVQLELGDTATPFEHRSYGDELARCQRYYRHFQSDDSSYMPFFGGMCITGTIAGYVIPMIPKMRNVPTLETSGTASHYEVYHGGTSVACSAVPALDGQSELDALDLRATVASGLTVGDGCYLRASNTTNAYLALDAEL